MKRIIVMFFAVALCFSVSAQTDYVETWDPDADGDGLIGVSDLLALLGVFQEEDMDNDGIWDSQDDCVGEYDECGVCNGPGPQILGIDTIIVYYDSLYAEAIDEWWVFEVDADTLLTYLCENPGCMDPTADNYDPYAIEEDNSCVWADGSPVCDFQNTYTFDGYTYDLVAIGDQCWFAENLRTLRYSNGDLIPNETMSESEWQAMTDGASIIYGEGNWECSDYAPNGDACDEEWALNQFGRLYNWYAVDDYRGLCPTGWHVPTDGEWMTLEMALGMTESDANGQYWRGTDQGAQMKNADGWYNGWNGTNESGFYGLPGGNVWDHFGDDLYFSGGGLDAKWWSATLNEDYVGSPPYLPWGRYLSASNDGVFRDFVLKSCAFSVRCVKDAD